MLDNQLDLFHNIEEEGRPNTTFFKSENKLSSYREKYAQISWKQLLIKIWIAARVPFVAAKYQILTRVRNYLRTQPFPWLKVALVFLLVYVYFKKDLKFNINMGAPTTALSDANPNNVTALSIAQSSIPKKASRKSIITQLPNENVQAYINRFSKVALVEMNKYKIPASIKMGQAILASHAGKNTLAQQYNNHFAITCEGGDNCNSYQTAAHHALVRTYQSAWESWRAHSLLLSTPTYNHLKRYGNNYKNWAHGLAESGYGNEAYYGAELIECIEKYELYKLDK
jgi:flagellum-specific peptidoglycan hydrolase FlgJ